MNLDTLPKADSSPAVSPSPSDGPQARIDWRELVPAQYARQFGGMVEELFVALADNASASLATLLSANGVLDNAELTLAAEAMGRSENTALVRKTLLPLLKHSVPVVREGAMYGLACLGSRDIRLAIETMARRDDHQGVRRAAEAVLASWSSNEGV